MVDFKKIFGANREDIRKNCLMLPMDDRGLFKSLNAKPGAKGMLFDISHSDICTVIYLKHMCFSGDCLIMLKETDCENLILFGSCGALKGDVGDKILPSRSMNLESFADFLKQDGFPENDYYYPDRKLVEKFENSVDTSGYMKYTCATVSSLVLEEEKTDMLLSAGIDCLDMEISSVFSAASRSGIKAMALFYAAEVIGKLHFYDKFDLKSRAKIKGAKRSMADKLVRFIVNELG
ncbi:MAG: hypothetical protein ABIH89_05210 [Elusimicrobiota bacterium]